MVLFSDISEWLVALRVYAGSGQLPYPLWSGSNYNAECPNDNDRNIYKSELVEKWSELNVYQVKVKDTFIIPMI